MRSVVLLAALASAQVYQLTSETFDVALQEGPLFVKFYAPWCGHCKRLSPAWDALGELVKQGELGGTRVAKVDCTSEKGLQQRYGVRSYPTLLYLGSDGTMKKHLGNRELDALADFARDGWRHANDYDPSFEPPKHVRKSVFRLLRESPALLAMLLLALAFIVGAVACCLMPDGADDDDDEPRVAPPPPQPSPAAAKKDE